MANKRQTIAEKKTNNSLEYARHRLNINKYIRNETMPKRARTTYNT